MQQELSSSLTIKNITAFEDLIRVNTLEAIVWSPEDTVPISHTMATIKNGGLILGAFHEDELIGFQYSFPGFDGKKIYLVSHSLGIHPNYRRLGIGERLKLEQRKVAQQKGYDVLRWTYDPLETVNANLNLHKLRAVCTSYIENAYGEMVDGMNKGIASDRFNVEWHIGDKAEPKSKLDSRDYPFLIQTSIQNDLLTPGEINRTETSDKLLVPVPSNFQEIKKKDFSLALMWREKTRKVFSHYLSQGWLVTDLIKSSTIESEYVYLLEKQD